MGSGDCEEEAPAYAFGVEVRGAGRLGEERWEEEEVGEVDGEEAVGLELRGRHWKVLMRWAGRILRCYHREMRSESMSDE